MKGDRSGGSAKTGGPRSAPRNGRSAPADALLSALPVGVLTYDATGQCESANEAASALLGVPHDVLLKQNFHRISCWLACGLVAPAEETLRSGRPFHTEVAMTTSAGRDVVLDWRFQPFGRNGQSGLLVVFADLTERDRMRDSLSLMRFSLDNASDCI
jgi:PAS domain-containing protein